MKFLLVMCWSLVMVCASFGGKLPEVYKPYEKLLGTWEGDNQAEVKIDGKKWTVQSRHKETYRYDEKLGLIMGEQVEIITVDGKEETSKSRCLIGWDETSQTFRIMTWRGGDMAALAIVSYEDGVFTSRTVGLSEGDKNETRFYLDENGVMCIKGVVNVTGDKNFEATWDFKLKRVK
ncbi:hypothetical protein SAMN02745181_0268 [Rubritalea squalenifaciens DSM 18772]|uniref:DUF1579 domain-containing protein n=1 Tax=Rubritalea squalenifaciens DSM 18772 TaxID=1123071 RepID=A0A1M6BNU3_9BACT|nr:hypothetical protein [Rubritalea squalenifaciens]SHI50213.1 hypothetical protein SAMN02745181_0268 [Rubritalea squalenifaciens DSM 18772]